MKVARIAAIVRLGEVVIANHLFNRGTSQTVSSRSSFVWDFGNFHPRRSTSLQMSRLNVWGVSLRLVSGLAAVVLTLAAILYAPIALSAQPSTGMDVRTHLVLVVAVISATGTWIMTVRPNRRAARFVTSLAGGFNGIWIFSGIGLPVVVASFLAVLVAAFGLPRRLVAVVVSLALVGLALGLLVLRLTEPPGEHLFG